MKIKNWTSFIAGIVIGLLSIVPFSYMNHADKFQIQNCDKFTGTVSEVSVDFKRRSEKQDGWKIGLKEHIFKVRIVGEYYNALDRDAFGQLVKPNAIIQVLLVKPSNFGLFERINQNNGLRDAAGIKVNGTEVLSITKLNERLSNLYWTNLTFGLLAIGFGLFFIYQSTK